MYKTLPLVYLLLIGSLLLTSGCDSGLDGNLNENQPPRTFLTVDSIDISDENRLSSRVDISWWGTDPDGFITGYEFAIQDTSAGNWQFTTRTDSTFLLPITPGAETDDVLFAVRAIDNDGAVDPVGASVVFPLRNSPPETNLVQLELPPDTTYSIVSFGWRISDPDGQATILRTEIAFNDTTNGWLEIPLETEEQESFFITLDIDNTTINNTTAEIFRGRALRSSGLMAEGLNLNADNTFYVRTVDRALEVSEVQEVTWHIKEQTSTILFLNDDAAPDGVQKGNFHLSMLNQLGFTPDVINISDGEGLEGGAVRLTQAFPRIINPTLNKMLAQWDHIYWISNDLTRNINFGQEILNEFFGNGGTLFVNIPVRRLSAENPLQSFLAIQRFVPIDPSQAERGFQIRDNSDVTPMNGGPVLLYNGGIDNNRWPFETVGGSVDL
ncbi:MAG: hypothetical protein ACNA78_04865 [Balneolaceae bacterium]